MEMRICGRICQICQHHIPDRFISFSGSVSRGSALTSSSCASSTPGKWLPLRNSNGSRTWKISESTPAWSLLVPNQPYPYCKWPTLQLLSALIAEYPSGWITSDQYQIVFHQFCGWRSIYLTWLYELICIFEVLIQVYIYIWTHIHVMSQPKTPINC